MEDVLKWSSNPDYDSRFLIVDSSGTRIRHCEAQLGSEKSLRYHELARLEKIPEFTAFDWSFSDDNLVALGNTLGEANVLQLDKWIVERSWTFSFPVKQQRECTAIAFSHGHWLAAGLKKHRTDASLNIYDIGTHNTGVEPFKRLAYGDAVTDVKWFIDQPETLLTGIQYKGFRLYDLRGMYRSSGCRTSS